MVQDQIIREIDAAIEKIRRGNGDIKKSAYLYEQLGRTCARLRGASIAYRKSERAKGKRIREALESK